MQLKPQSLLIALSLTLTSLACTQQETGDRGQERAKDETLAQVEKHPEGEARDEHAAGHSHESAKLHGGLVSMTSENHFEVVFAPEEVRVYGYSGEQSPINEMNDVTVTLTLQEKGGDAEKLALDYVGPNADAGRSQGYFATPHEFGEVEEGQMKATFVVSGMGSESIKFKTAVGVSPLTTYACPMHPDVTGEDPVSCSKCGMALTKQMHAEDGEHGHEGHEGHDH